MNAGGFTKQLVFFGLIFGMKYLPPLENYTNYIVPGYIATNLIFVLGYYWMISKVRALPESERTKKIYPSNKNRKDLKEGDVKTREEYDVDELNQAIKRTVIQLAISLFLWYKWDFVRHFVMQFVSQIMNAFTDDKMILCYVFGKDFDRSAPKELGFMEKIKQQLEEQEAKLKEEEKQTASKKKN